MPASIGTVSQTFPPKPTFTEANLPDLHGKVYIITGSNTGVGKELARLLYSKNARVYVAARSADKAAAAIKEIQEAAPKSTGSLAHLQLDLADLGSIKATAADFTARESRLDVLFHNAGVMIPPEGSTTAQGHELQMGVHALGPLLLTNLLTPVLTATAKTAPPDSVRVVWVSSLAAESMAPKGGIDVDQLSPPYAKGKEPTRQEKYGMSKTASYLLAFEYGRRVGATTGIVSVALNPGLIKTDLQRHFNPVQRFVAHAMFHPAVFGAYTELFAGLSTEIKASALRESREWSKSLFSVGCLRLGSYKVPHFPPPAKEYFIWEMR